MNFIFGVIGVILGGLMGEAIGALVGLAIGLGLAAMFDNSRRENDPGTTAAQDRAMTAANGLEARIRQLEREVQSLRVQVSSLSERLAAGAGLGSATAGDNAARSQPQPAPAVPAPAAVASTKPEPEPDLEFEPEIELEPAATRAAPAEAAAAASAVPLEALPPQAAGPAGAAQTLAAQPLAAVPLGQAQPAQGPAAIRNEAEQAGRIAAQAPAALAASSPPAQASKPVRAAPPSLQERLPAWVRDWIFGGNTIVKVGVLILFLGLAFLLRYAAERVTVPVEVGYAGVALVGAILLGIGWRLRERGDAAGGRGYGLILQGAGIGVFYLTILAALKLDALLPPQAAFAFLFLVAVLSAVLAVVQNASWLAYVAAAEGFAAPLLVSSGGGHHIALFSYLAVLDLGIFLVAWHRAWRPLNLIGCAGTFMLAAGWAERYYTDALYPSTQAFLLLFFGLFTAIGVLFARRALAADGEPDPRDPLARRAAAALSRVGRVDSGLVFGVPLASYGLQYLMVHEQAYGPAWSAFGFSFFYLMLGGWLIRGRNPRYSLLGEAYVVVSVLFGTLTIPLALEGSWTGATWAVEAAGMYWLGMRQQRVYARVFSMLVLAGAVWGVLGSLGLDLRAGTPLLTGPVLGMLLLSAGALAMYGVGLRRARTGAVGAAPAASPQAVPGSADGGTGSWEDRASVGFLWTGLAAFACIPWLLFAPQWACVATALIGFGCALQHARVRLPGWQAASAALHVVAVAGFAGSLHGMEGAAMLSNGWQGLSAAIVIGASLLATGWLPLQAALRQARAGGTTPDWSLGSSIGLLAGVGMLGGSLLFVMPADAAARIWPWMGVAALWLALRLLHPALVVAWGALQIAAGVALLAFGPALWSSDTASLTLWTPLGLTLAALLSGDWLQRAARQGSAAWLREAALQWTAVLWASAWWIHVLLPDTLRYLEQGPADGLAWWPIVLTAWVLLSSLLAAGLARWRRWEALGQLTACTVPAWTATAWLGLSVFGQAPHAYLGWLVWPLAAAWHGVLLRLQSRWWPAAVLKPLHVLGFWLFVLLASREAQGWAAGWGDAGSAWTDLGWVLVPALALGLVTRPRALQRWPLSDFRDTYLGVACVPLALYLWLWLWVSNLGAGSAAPLPYVPLLNPLEVGHGLVLLALVLWQRTAPVSQQALVPARVLLGALAATLFALYTGMVLRACHHWIGVPWEAGALFASMQAQSALSAAWSLLGVALMMTGHRKARRLVWAVGAALLGVVVLKLFFVELADRGGLYRIVSFIVVGVLLLMVGYFAPVPPGRDAAASRN